MKVLFAMGSTQKSKNVADRYYDKFGEMLEYEDVFYFKALLDKVKQNKTYNVIIIHEDLEQYKVKDIEQLDRKLFSYVDSITDEAQDADIIYICSDRRTKEDQFVVRLYSIGIYNILLGDDRNVSKLCDIIKRPKTKREAKEYLNIDSGSINETGIIRDDEVDETQMMNILNYYEKIKEEPGKYVETFDRISTQYSRAQLKVIASCLPKYVQEVLYNEPKYKFLLLFDGTEQKRKEQENKTIPNVKKIDKKPSQDFFGVFKKNTEKIIKNIHHKTEKHVEEKKELTKNDSSNDDKVKIQQELSENTITEQKIQQELAKKARKEAEEKMKQELAEKTRREEELKEQQKIAEKIRKEAEARQQKELTERAKQEEAYRKQEEQIIVDSEVIVEKINSNENKSGDNIEEQKKLEEKVKLEANLKQQELDEKSKVEAELKIQQELLEQAKKEEELKRTEIEALDKKIREEELKLKDELNTRLDIQNSMSDEQRRFKEEQEKLEIEQEKIRKVQAELEEEKRKLREEQERLLKEKNQLEVRGNIETRATYEMATVTPLNYKKVVAFVGANKAGTSFMVNAVADNLSNQKILTSILDMTKDRSMYYIYNQSDKTLRKIAGECMQRLSDGEDSYMPVSKYLKVYTTIPGGLSDSRRGYKHKSIIETVKNNNNVTIIDADFTTPIDYFDVASEIYIVQDLDILKIQETTMFLREMKNRNIDMSKIRIVVNKYVKNLLTPKKIVEGLSYYKDPEMTFIDTLLSNKVMYSIVPYNLNNYIKYTESLYKGTMSFKGYSADFIEAINDIANQIYSRNGQLKKSKGGFFG